jgi:hypothetical protein
MAQLDHTASAVFLFYQTIRLGKVVCSGVPGVFIHREPRGGEGWQQVQNEATGK